MHLLFFIKHDTVFKMYASNLLKKESSHTSKFRKPWTIHKLTHRELPSNGICGSNLTIYLRSNVAKLIIYPQLKENNRGCFSCCIYLFTKLCLFSKLFIGQC